MKKQGLLIVAVFSVITLICVLLVLQDTRTDIIHETNNSATTNDSGKEDNDYEEGTSDSSGIESGDTSNYKPPINEDEGDNNDSVLDSEYTPRECMAMIDEILVKASKGKDNPMASLGGFSEQLGDIYDKHGNIVQITEKLDSQLDNLDTEDITRFNVFAQDFIDVFGKVKESKANQDIDGIINHLDTMLVLMGDYITFLEQLL